MDDKIRASVSANSKLVNSQFTFNIWKAKITYKMVKQVVQSSQSLIFYIEIIFEGHTYKTQCACGTESYNSTGQQVYSWLNKQLNFTDNINIKLLVPVTLLGFTSSNIATRVPEKGLFCRREREPLEEEGG